MNSGITKALISGALVLLAVACSEKETQQQAAPFAEAETPEEAINKLIAAYKVNNLEAIRSTLGAEHRFGNNIVSGLQWLGNCMAMDNCIKTPVQVVETKTVDDQVAVGVLAKNLLGAPMTVWFVTRAENGVHKVTGMDPRYKCALMSQAEKVKAKSERQSGDYDICWPIEE